MPQAPAPIRTLLVDDHGVLRDGLRAILLAQPDILLVGEAADGRSALTMILAEQPDVVLLDLSLPLMTGLEVLRALEDKACPSRVVVLSMQDEPATVAGALQLGALGFLSKGAPASEMLTALRAVAAGRRYLPPYLAEPVLRAMMQGARSGGTARAIDALSRREREVMRLLCEGLSGSEIGLRLGVSVKSVDTYRARLMSKLGVSDLPSLVKLALRERLIDP